MPVDPNNCSTHEELKDDVVEFCQSIGCVVADCGYESVFNDGVRDVLSKTGDSDMTSLYVRSRKDLIATHPELKKTLLLDPKTTSWIHCRRNDFPIEMIPFLHAARNWMVDVKTLFCCRYIDRFQFGMWPDPEMCSKLIDVRFPSRKYNSDQCESLMRHINQVIPSIGYSMRSRGRNSGDAYTRISNETARNQPDWKDMIRGYFSID